MYMYVYTYVYMYNRGPNTIHKSKRRKLTKTKQVQITANKQTISTYIVLNSNNSRSGPYGQFSYFI